MAKLMLLNNRVVTIPALAAIFLICGGCHRQEPPLRKVVSDIAAVQGDLMQPDLFGDVPNERIKNALRAVPYVAEVRELNSDLQLFEVVDHWNRVILFGYEPRSKTESFVWWVSACASLKKRRGLTPVANGNQWGDTFVNVTELPIVPGCRRHSSGDQQWRLTYPELARKRFAFLYPSLVSKLEGQGYVSHIREPPTPEDAR